jgi:adenosylhomocysteine nucleosidase
MNPPTFRLGLISALQQEQAGLIDQLQAPSTVTRGMRDYVRGNLWGIDCVCVLSRIGKTAAAATAAMLIERFDITHLLFTGVAGGADAQVHVGDIVLAQTLVQHDMDARPLFPRFEVPLLGHSHFDADADLCARLDRAARRFLSEDFAAAMPAGELSAFGLHRPQLHRGVIASGDEFVNSRERLAQLQSALPGLLAVEMEGAAVAQVCFEFGIPFAVMRTISDSADEHAPVSFSRFVDRVAAPYAFGVVRRLCETFRTDRFPD